MFQFFVRIQAFIFLFSPFLYMPAAASELLSKELIEDAASFRDYIYKIEPSYNDIYTYNGYYDAKEVDKRIAANFEAFELRDDIHLYAISYLNDGLKIRGYMLTPTLKGPHPAIIYNRGGNRAFASLSGPRSSAMFKQLAEIASWGYVVIASDYRGGVGSDGYDRFGGDDVRDILALPALLEKMPNVDATRIGMYGHSRGSMMSFASVKNNLNIKALVLTGVISDLEKSLERRPGFGPMWAEMDPANYSIDATKWLRDRSVIRWLDRIPRNLPILMLTGSSDWRTNSSQTLVLATKLDELGQPLRLMLYEGSDHALSQHQGEVLGQMREWFERFVKNGEIPPAIDKTPQSLSN